MTDEFRLAIARWKIGQLRGEEVPDLASRAIEAGMQSPALAELATLDKPPLRDVEPFFARGYA